MTFPTPELHFTFRIVVLFVAGLVATIAYYWVVAKLKEAGIRTPMFGNVKGMLKTFETYRHLAPEKSWPTWPVTAYWTALAIGFIIAITVYFIPLK